MAGVTAGQARRTRSDRLLKRIICDRLPGALGAGPVSWLRYAEALRTERDPQWVRP